MGITQGSASPAHLQQTAFQRTALHKQWTRRRAFATMAASRTDRGGDMRRWTVSVGCLLALVVAMPGQAQDALDLTPYLKSDQFERIKISPSGDYFALTMPLEDRTVLGIVRRQDKVATAKVTGGANSVVDDFWWASDERMVVSMAQRLGSRDEPVAIGQLHAIDADGRTAACSQAPTAPIPTSTACS